MNETARASRYAFLRFVAFTVVIGVLLNEIWEMAQMAAYVETADQPFLSTLALCTRAALGDVVILLGIYFATALTAAEPTWGLRGRWNHYFTTALLGLCVAALIEHAALSAGRWNYTAHMLNVPYLNAGFWPLLQMALLPPITFWLARRWVNYSGKVNQSTS